MRARSLLTIIAFFSIAVIVFTVGLAIYDANTDDFRIPRLGYGGVISGALLVLAACAKALGGSRSIRDS